MTDIKVGAEAHETVSARIVESNVTRITYDMNDPYDTPEEHAETNDFIFKTFFFWTGANGTFSTWRERHVFLRGFFSGFKTKLQDKFGEVPEMWADEGQYYEFGQEAGYVLRNAIIFALAGSVTTIAAPTIVTSIIKLFGM